MGNSDEDNKQSALIPSWQQAASQPPDDSSSETPSSESILERARSFLQDEEVKNSSREKKVEFLKSKGIEEADIDRLLDESSSQTTRTESTPKTPQTEAQTQPQPPESEPELRKLKASPPPENRAADHPPIVTYPEFLTKPTKPPPLITASGLLNSLGLVAGASALVYGATRHLVKPMVTTLTSARIDLHQTAAANLTQLVERLEGAVSEIPASYHHHNNKKSPVRAEADDATASSSSSDGNSSSYEDPTELFHRDIGVQTSPPLPSPSTPPPPLPASSSSSSSTPADQTDRLNRLSLAVRSLAADVVHQAEDLAEAKNVLDRFGSDLHGLTYPPESFGVGSSYLYGAAGRTEPDDEIKKVKMSIRGVKGVLLSTRSFPATTS